MRRTRIWAVGVWALALSASVAAGELPLVSEIAPPKAAGAAGAGQGEKEAFPRDLEVEEARLEAADLLPAGPLFHFESANGERMGQAFDETALALFLNDPRTQGFLKDTPLTLPNLFVDLPSRWSRAEALQLWRGAWFLADGFLRTAGRVTLTGYRAEGGGLHFVLLAETGRARKAAFEELDRRLDLFLQDAPTLVPEEGAHGDDYQDVLRAADGGAELVCGVVRQFVFVANSAALGRSLLAAGKGAEAGRVLSADPGYRELGSRTDSQAQVVGFLDPRSLIAEAKQAALPGAVELTDLAADFVGRGRKDGGRLWYDCTLDGRRFRERLLSPTEVDAQAGEIPGLPARLVEIGLPAGTAEREWVTPRMVPYQPAPEIFLAAQVKPAPFLALLETPQAFGSSDYATQLAAAMPEVLRRDILPALKPAAAAALRGETALALFPQREGRRDWLLLFALRNAAEAEACFGARTPVHTAAGLRIHGAKSAKWEEAPCWAVFADGTFRGLGASYLVVASSGTLMQSLVDQATTRTADLSENKDFQAQIAAAGRQGSLLAYVNLPERAVTARRDLPSILREYMPAIRAGSGRPPLAEHMAGLAVSAAPGDGGCRTVVTGPLPIMPAFAAALTINMPRWIRERERAFLSRSRSNLGRMWLELQCYATRHGHFPESLEALRKLFPAGQQASLFLVDAAVEEYGLEEATKRSFEYVPGLRATDEPDMPIVVEGAPWHWEYSGMFPAVNQAAAEKGTYERWRLVLRLDGSIRAISEDEYKRRILPRLQGRER